MIEAFDGLLGMTQESVERALAELSPEQASALLWAAFRSGDYRETFEQSWWRGLLARNVQGVTAEDVLAFGRLEAEVHGGFSRGVFEREVFRLFQNLLKREDAPEILDSLEGRLDWRSEVALATARLAKGDAPELSDAVLFVMLCQLLGRTCYFFDVHRNVVDSLAQDPKRFAQGIEWVLCTAEGHERVMAEAFAFDGFEGSWGDQDGTAPLIYEPRSLDYRRDVVDACEEHLSDLGRVVHLCAAHRWGFLVTPQALEALLAIDDVEALLLDFAGLSDYQYTKGRQGTIGWLAMALKAEARGEAPSEEIDRWGYFSPGFDVALERRALSKLSPERRARLLGDAPENMVLRRADENELLDGYLKKQGEGRHQLNFDVAWLTPSALPVLEAHGLGNIAPAQEAAAALMSQIPEAAPALFRMIPKAKGPVFSRVVFSLFGLGENARKAAERALKGRHSKSKRVAEELLYRLSLVRPKGRDAAIRPRWQAIVDALVENERAKWNLLSQRRQLLEEFGQEALDVARSLLIEGLSGGEGQAWERGRLLADFIDLAAEDYGEFDLEQPYRELGVELALLVPTDPFVPVFPKQLQRSGFDTRAQDFANARKRAVETIISFRCPPEVAANALLGRRPFGAVAQVSDVIFSGADNADCQRALVQLFADGDAKVRKRCARALRPHPEAAIFALPLLQSSTAAMRERGALLLGMFGQPSSAAAIADALRKEKATKVSLVLEAALAKCGGAPEEAPKTGKSWRERLAVPSAKKPPRWLDTKALGELRLASGERLDEASIAALLQRFQGEPARFSPLLAELSEALDPESAMAFGNALYGQWIERGCKPPERWCLYALATLANEDWVHRVGADLLQLSDVRRDAPFWYARVLARFSPGLAWLAHWATVDIAVSQRLRGVACSVCWDALGQAGKETSLEQLQALGWRIADERRERFGRRFGFGEDGERSLGESTLVLADDGGLRVRTAKGKLQASLPKKSSEADKAFFRSLKKDLKQERGQCAAVLERAMVDEHRWTFEEFGVVLAHPILRGLAASLVFRVGEVLVRPCGGELLDADGDAVVPKGSVKVEHPLNLKTSELELWQRHFEGLGAEQPFEQLHREVFGSPEEPVVSAKSLDASFRAPLQQKAFVAALKRDGWQIWTREEHGLPDGSVRSIGRGHFVDLEYMPIYQSARETETMGVGIRAAIGRGRLKEVPAVVFSETQRALARLIRASKVEQKSVVALLQKHP